MEFDQHTWELLKNAHPRRVDDDVMRAKAPEYSTTVHYFLVSAYPYGWEGHVRGLLAVREHHAAAQALVEHLDALGSSSVATVLRGPHLEHLPRHWAQFPVDASPRTHETAVRLTLDGLPPRSALQSALALG